MGVDANFWEAVWEQKLKVCWTITGKKFLVGVCNGIIKKIVSNEAIALKTRALSKTEPLFTGRSPVLGLPAVLRLSQNASSPEEAQACLSNEKEEETVIKKPSFAKSAPTCCLRFPLCQQKLLRQTGSPPVLVFQVIKYQT